MAKSTLAEEFEIKRQLVNYDGISDYEIFTDKVLLDKLRTKIVESLIDHDLSADQLSREFINKEIEKATINLDLSSLEYSHLLNLIDNEINGYGPLTELLNDDNINEIMINGPAEVYIEVEGKLIKNNNISFIDNQHILRTIQKLIEPLGKVINDTNPLIDTRLPDGSRINAIIPPLSKNGPVITIRKFSQEANNIEDYIRKGSLTPYMARFIEGSVIGNLNILICGTSGSGKTSLINAIANLANEKERIITVEETAELNLKNPHVIALESQESNNNIDIKNVFKNVFNMRPDRIIFGEIKGSEAFDIIQAMNSGHNGMITSIYANSTTDALNRLEMLASLSNIELTNRAIKEYICRAIDVIIFIEKLNDGKRKITNISEIAGIKNEKIELNPIFAFKQSGLTNSREVIGEYILYPEVPRTYRKLKQRGIKGLEDIFEQKPLVDLPNLR